MSAVKFIFLFITILICSELYAQSSERAIVDGYKALLRENYKKDKSELTPPLKKEKKDFIKTRYRSSKDRINNDFYIIDPALDAYFVSLKNRIASANPDLDFDQTKILLSSYTHENAFSIGDGTIVVNVGLLKYVEDEAQLAFILCHEFAHYFLDHSYKEFLRRLNRVNGNEWKDQLANLEDEDGEQLSELKKLIKANIYSDRYHSRTYEVEADSFGLEIFMRAGYSVSDAVSTLAMLDTVSDISFSVDIYGLLGIDSSDVSISKSRLDITDNNVNEEDILHNDSMKTHPDCDHRIELIKKGWHDEGLVKAEGYDEFTDLKDQVQDYFLKSLIKNKNASELLLYELDKWQAGDSTPHGNKMIIAAMWMILDGRENHRVTRVVGEADNLDHRCEKDLAVLCVGMRYRDLARVFYEFGKERFAYSEQDAETYILQMEIAKKARLEDEFLDLRESYLEKFDSSDYGYYDVKEMEY